ncbi:MAG: Gfo/Idh/MocA family oxidoreductase [Erysipelotrichaceae bacterium]|nr:Gfo/Idh/MocA family oxidoreductase [Erysipelotrichaceae bacterium]
MKVVTVGTSNICELLIDGFKEAGIEVFACVGRDPQKTKEFAKKNGVLYHAYNYDAVIKSDAFDTVYIALPNSLHYEYGKKALLAGKNVIMEKPFATNLDQAKELVSIANSKQLFIYDANTALHSMAFKQLKKDISQLGQIRMVDLDFSKYSSKYDEFLSGATPNVFNPHYAGGALMDLGIYNIAFTIGLFGLPKAVRYFPNMQRGIDTSGVAILKYDGFIVSASNGKDASRGALINIKGEKGCITAYQSASVLDEYTIELNNGEKKVRKFDKIGHYHDELVDFKSIDEYKNIRKNNEYLTITLMCIKVLDDLRKSCGLEFDV